MLTHLVGAALALLAFAAALFAGILADNPATTTLARATLALVCCYLVGLAIGAVAEGALQEHIDEYKTQHPLEEADPAKIVSSDPTDGSPAPHPAVDDGAGGREMIAAASRGEAA